MRKIVLGLAVTLDGFIEGPNGEYDWCFTDGDYGMKEFLSGIDAILYGRKSYELMMKLEGEGQNPFRHLRSYVFSRSPRKSTDNVQWISGEVYHEVLKLKEQPGKDLWLFGGASLTTEFFNLQLVDRIWLSVHPILLGSGKLLFQNIQKRVPLKLIETKPYPSGLVSLTYEIIR